MGRLYLLAGLRTVFYTSILVKVIMMINESKGLRFLRSLYHSRNIL